MGPSSTQKLDADLGDRLEALLVGLRRGGLEITPNDWVMAHVVVAEAMTGRSQGEDIGIAAFRDPLAALLCRSRENRAAFDLVFDAIQGAAVPPTPIPSSTPAWRKLRVGAVGGILLAVILTGLTGYVAFQVISDSRAVSRSLTTWEPLEPNTQADTNPVPRPDAGEANPGQSRLREVGSGYDDAPTLSEVSVELARTSPIGWSADAYLTRLNEITGLPVNQPVPTLKASGPPDPVQASRVARAIGLIEHPGRDPVAALAPPATRAGALDDVIDRVAGNGDVTDVDTLRLSRAKAVLDPTTIPPFVPPLPGPPTAPAWFGVAIAFLPLLCLVVWFARASRLRKAFLRRRSPTMRPSRSHLIAEEMRRLLDGPADRRLIRRLQRRASVPAAFLDVDRTVAASMPGHIVPVFGAVRRTPEYLFLIERTSAHDLDTQRILTLIDRLDRQVHVDIWFYQSDPGWVSPLKPGPARPLSRIRAEMPDHRLVIVGSGRGFFDVTTRRLLPSVAALQQWRRRVMLTTVPSAEWAAEERWISDQLQIPIGRATVSGIQALPELLGLENDYDRGLRRPPEDWFAHLPALLRSDGMGTGSIEPAPEATADLIRTLRRYLGAAGFDWLAALAVYPGLHWGLTVYLGARLPLREDGPATPALYDERRLANLTRLPWFRRGALPAWLRRALIASVSTQRMRQVQAELARLLKAGVPSDDATGLTIAQDRGLDPLMAGEIFEDEIFLDTLSKNSVEDLELPRAAWLARFLPPSWQGLAGWVELAGVIVAVCYALAAWRLAPGPDDGPWSVTAFLPLLTLAAGAAVIWLGFHAPRTVRIVREGLYRAAPTAATLAFVSLSILLVGGYARRPSSFAFIALLTLPILLVGIPPVTAWVIARFNMREAKHRSFIRAFAQGVLATIVSASIVAILLINPLNTSSHPIWLLAYLLGGALLAAIGVWAGRARPRKTRPWPTRWTLSPRRAIAATAGVALVMMVPAFVVQALTATKIVTFNASAPASVVATMEPGSPYTVIAALDGSIAVWKTSDPHRPLAQLAKARAAAPAISLAVCPGRNADTLAVWAADGAGRLSEYVVETKTGSVLAATATELGATGVKPLIACSEGLALMALDRMAPAEAGMDMSGGTNSGTGPRLVLKEQGQTASELPMNGEAPVSAIASVSGRQFLIGLWDGSVGLVSAGPTGVATSIQPGWLSGAVRLIRFRSSGDRNSPHIFDAIGDDGAVAGVWVQNGTITRHPSAPLSAFRLGPAVPWNGALLSGPSVSTVPASENLSPVEPLPKLPQPSSEPLLQRTLIRSWTLEFATGSAQPPIETETVLQQLSRAQRSVGIGNRTTIEIVGYALASEGLTETVRSGTAGLDVAHRRAQSLAQNRVDQVDARIAKFIGSAAPRSTTATVVDNTETTGIQNLQGRSVVINLYAMSAPPTAD